MKGIHQYCSIKSVEKDSIIAILRTFMEGTSTAYCILHTTYHNIQCKRKIVSYPFSPSSIMGITLVFPFTTPNRSIVSTADRRSVALGLN
jgi:hypothetical protein